MAQGVAIDMRPGQALREKLLRAKLKNDEAFIY